MGLEALRDTLAASKLVSYAGRLWDYWETTANQDSRTRSSTSRAQTEQLWSQLLSSHSTLLHITITVTSPLCYHVPVADAMYDLITAVSVVCSFYNSFINSSAPSLEFISVR
ncbi:BnaA03g58850D [Brassica napus]|uniref:BnaA03g58850D protein n=1 Tax=Brassica napus TaxID=3708 RepID=A0A078J6A9_BRANA|nr:BnaA03g58850D [Brassica napus]